MQKMEWVLVEFNGTRKTILREKLQCAVLKFLFCRRAVLRHDFVKLCAHRADRAEGAACALKDHAKLRPVQLPQLSCRQIRKVPPFIPDVAPRHHAAASEKTHGSFQQCGFPAAAFSDNSENLAGAQRKAHILYCRNSVVGNVHMVISQ